MSLDHHFAEPTAIRTNLGAIFVSLELSRSTWLITPLSPGGGEKMSKHGLSAGNIAALLARLSELKQKAFARTGQSFQVIVIQEAGLDGFWIHRVLQSEELRAMSSMRPQLRPRGAGGGPRPTGSTAKPWCALCWRTNAAKAQQVWAIRFWLDLERRLRDRAMFDLAIDSKLRGCDIVKIKIGDQVSGGRVRSRAIVVQQKTGRPVQFVLLEPARGSLLVWFECRGGALDDYAFPSRIDRADHISTRHLRGLSTNGSLRSDCAAKFRALVFASLLLSRALRVAKLRASVVIARETARASAVVCSEATLHGQL